MRVASPPLSSPAAGLKDGSVVTLQVKHGTKWVSLAATTKVHKAAYKFSSKLQEKGKEVLRVKDGKTPRVGNTRSTGHVKRRPTCTAAFGRAPNCALK
ncbi:hypothetical protein OHB14_39765 [Streptomyces sp. NBC_01613]|uniref:hypothetical protein n=1 Tax=Streptomyces sp. NBC_01613 TaxID=2975896 RepID=UPI003864E337